VIDVGTIRTIAEGRATIYVGDCLERLRDIPSASVRTCVTSPPYFGLRDYGTATWIGGGLDCNHAGEPMRTLANVNRHTGSGSDRKNAEGRQFFREVCGVCGAKRVDDQIGLESTPEEYVERLVEVFREVRRVLTDDGTVWLNLGDSYATDSIRGARDPERWPKQARNSHVPDYPNDPRRIGLKPKDLIGIPWRVAFALQADGWFLRQDIIWHKPNPMPESVRDRCTKAHEYVFLLSKSARYHYDADAVAEPVARSTVARLTQSTLSMQAGSIRQPGKSNGPMAAVGGTEKRNRRSVWRISSRPYKGAHFAVMPPDLVEPCILAGSRPGDAVLDPFAGSGTTGVVAVAHGRRFVGVELNADYVDLAIERIESTVPEEADQLELFEEE
jgi:DNA modification methylase